MKLRILFVTLFLALLGSIVFAQSIETKKAPDFTLPDIDGNNISMSKSLGQGPIYVSFWATWCKPCCEELKIMEKIYERHKDQGFQIFAINTEGPKAAAKIKSFVTSYGITFRVLLDNDGEVFHRKFKGSNMPFSNLVDSNGRVVFAAVGFKPGDEKEIEKLIIENLPTPADSSKARKTE
jgi:cytochrome c biogenesis protein CcmG, thiol:disulfide interchange protein DsbE